MAGYERVNHFYQQDIMPRSDKWDTSILILISYIYKTHIGVCSKKDIERYPIYRRCG